MNKFSVKIFYQAFIFLMIMSNVDEGFSQQKYKVEKVEIVGNENYSDRFIKKLMLTRKYNWLTRNYYRPNLFKDDLDAITNFYINEGYLEAKINRFEVKFDTLKKSVDIEIKIAEGERTRIAGISFFGNHVVSDSVLLKLIKSSLNKPFKKSVLENDTYKLLTYYADHGHIEAKVEPSLKLNQEKHEMLIDFNMKEGSQIRIGEFKISGTKKTKTPVILRELEFNKGEVYSYGKILKSQRQLYLTGLFTSVFIRPEEKSTEFQTIRNIRIDVDEKKNGELNFGVGYGTLDRMRGSVELLQNNLFGTARQAGVSAFASFITRRAELSFTEPWLFSTKTKADLNGFVEKREEPGYDLQRYGGRFILGRRFGKYTNLNLAYRYEIVKLSTQVSPQVLKPNEKGNTRSLTLTIIRDSRDDIVNTTRGTFSSLDIESAGAFLKGTSTFIKFTIRQKYFYSIMKRLVIGTSITSGWMGNYGLGKEIPIQERFFTGGATSIRGFKEKFIGPKNEFDNPVGGNVLLNINLFELRYTFYKKLSAIAFMDLGNVWTNSSSLENFDLRKGMGIGIRYNSPLGILRFDYGIKLDRRQDESFGEFYFSVGQAF
jgi:outer membrane protein insertion porin family